MFKKKIQIWPLAIILAFVVFCSSVIYAGVQMMSANINMDTENYYEKELLYQNQINREILTRELDKYLDFKPDMDKKQVVIDFPVKNSSTSTITGEVHFFRPSASDLDKRIAIELDEESKQRFPIQELKQGYWKIKVLWKQGRMEFYDESTLMIPE